jgi:hypothetical protein
MFEVVIFRLVFSDSLSNMDELAVKIYGPSDDTVMYTPAERISAYIINDINRAKKNKPYLYSLARSSAALAGNRTYRGLTWRPVSG